MVSSLAAATPFQAYQREATRLVKAVPRVPGKVVTRDASLNVGPLTIRYTAQDYEFDLGQTNVPGLSFSDALNAAGLSAELAAESADPTSVAPNGRTMRQALASYRAVQEHTDTVRSLMFSVTV